MRHELRMTAGRRSCFRKWSRVSSWEGIVMSGEAARDSLQVRLGCPVLRGPRLRALWPPRPTGSVLAVSASLCRGEIQTLANADSTPEEPLRPSPVGTRRDGQSDGGMCVRSGCGQFARDAPGLARPGILEACRVCMRPRAAVRAYSAWPGPGTPG